MARTISVWALFALLVVLYVYMVVAAIGNLLLLPDMAAQIGLSVNGIGWFWLWLGVLLPVTVFVLAAVLGRRQKRASRLLLFALGLALAAAMQLEILHLVPQASFFA